MAKKQNKKNQLVKKIKKIIKFSDSKHNFG